MFNMKAFTPLEYHRRAMTELKPRLAFQQGKNTMAWQAELRAKLRELLVVPAQWNPRVRACIKSVSEEDRFNLYETTFESEPNADVPGYLLKPKAGKPPFPVMICLQGHAKEGMKLSLTPNAKGGRDFALAAVRNGWAALALEQRCFGKRSGDCTRESMHALMLGKTLTGERVFDVLRAVDFIQTQPDLDASKIGCMGNSAGGTVTFYAACIDQRIRMAIVSCSYCSYSESWMKLPHCTCGYVPGIMKYADMGDLGGLVAPRHLIIVAGKTDHVAGFSGVQTAFERTQEVFRALNCSERAVFLAGEGGHNFYPDLAWPEITKIKNTWTCQTPKKGE